MRNENKFRAELVSLEQVYETCLRVAHKISGSGMSFDITIAIARGGFPPARFLCDFLNIETLHSLQVSHYSSGARKKEKAHIVSKDTGDIKDKNILLVDDVNDTGKSLRTAYDSLKEAAKVTTAVMHEKNTTGFRACFAGSGLKEWKWLIYPWAVTEDLLAFLDKGDMLNAVPSRALRYLKEEYCIDIEEDQLSNMLSFRSFYKR
ncbi:MAG: phosphoribosyltransferase [Bacteroidota bacterium]